MKALRWPSSQSAVAIFSMVFVIFHFSGCVTMRPYQPPRPLPKLVTKGDIDRHMDDTTRVRRIGNELANAMPRNEGTLEDQESLPFVSVSLSGEIKQVYGLGSGPGLLVGGIVRPDEMPLSDIRRGDEIVEIESEPIIRADQFYERLKRLQHAEDVRLRFRRGDYEWEEYIPIVRHKEIPLFVIDLRHGEVAAATDGKQIILVSQPMMEFVENDDQLAFVLGHELAHISLGHHRSQKGMNMTRSVVSAAVTGLVLSLASYGQQSDYQAYSSYRSNYILSSYAGQLAGYMVTSPFSRKQESEADQMALHYVKAAGFDPVRGAEFLRKLAELRSGTEGFNFTHPAPMDRYSALMAEYRPEGVETHHVVEKRQTVLGGDQ